MNARNENLGQKARFYFVLEVSLIAWALLTLATGGALALPSMALAVSTFGGMLIILWLGMHHPVYLSFRQQEVND